MWATLEQPGVPTGVKKDEMCVFTVHAHNKKRPSGKVVIMHSNIIWHKLRMNRACAQKKGGLQVKSLSCVLTGVSPEGVLREEMCVFTAPANKKKGAFRRGRFHAF